MLFVYLKVLGPGQRNPSCFSLAEGLSKYRRIVVSVGLDTPLVVHVSDVLPTGCGSRPIRLGLKSFFGPEILLHTKPMYPFIISRKDLPNECDVLSNVVQERLTQNSANTRSYLLR
jgi:hypothetical protein